MRVENQFSLKGREARETHILNFFVVLHTSFKVEEALSVEQKVSQDCFLAFLNVRLAKAQGFWYKKKSDVVLDNPYFLIVIDLSATASVHEEGHKMLTDIFRCFLTRNGSTGGFKNGENKKKRLIFC